MKIQFFIAIIFLCFAQTIFAQLTVTGKVLDENKEPLIGATVVWKGTQIGTMTDLNGNFIIARVQLPADLQITYIGYNPATVTIDPDDDNVDITIDGIQQLDEVEIVSRQRDNYTSTLQTRNIESIGSKEFRKAACCNLSESFETNATVDVAYTDAITGAKEVQMLGLRGIYTQMLLENRPSLGGLSTLFAMDYIPGTWLESVQITKGSGSVVNGYQSIAGQVNIELQKPHLDKKLFVNLFAGTAGRYEANVHLNKKFNEKWSSGVLLHGSTVQNNYDINNDKFKDELNRQQLNGMYRLFYESEKICSNLNIHAIDDRRNGGQLKAVNNPFLISTHTNRVEIFGKTGYKGFTEPYRSVGSQYSTTFQRMNLYFGNNRYEGEQESAYINLIYNTIIGTTDHKIAYGASYQYDKLQEQVNDTKYQRTESVPGVFGEYTWNYEPLTSDAFYKSIGIIGGLRADYHNLYGLLISPRINVKMNFTDDRVVRFSAGRGYRTANAFAENLGALVSNKIVRLNEKLSIEDAWNAGANYTHNFELWKRNGSFVLDFYHTQFINQIVMDRESNIRELQFYNLDGKSYSNSAIATVTYTVWDNLDIKLAYKWTDVKTTYKGDLRRQPLVPIHKGLITLDYETPNKGWRFNTNIQLVGTQRLPDNSHIPDHTASHFPAYSKPYVLINAQITKQFRPNFEVYVGGENLTNYHQKHAIIAYDDPYSPYFDATQIYAPVHNFRGYAGLRYSID